MRPIDCESDGSLDGWKIGFIFVLCRIHLESILGILRRIFDAKFT